jgi:hypothetical protein
MYKQLLNIKKNEGTKKFEHFNKFNFLNFGPRVFPEVDKLKSKIKALRRKIYIFKFSLKKKNNKKNQKNKKKNIRIYSFLKNFKKKSIFKFDL